jgi:hypothetical protein
VVGNRTPDNARGFFDSVLVADKVKLPPVSAVASAMRLTDRSDGNRDQNDQ